MPTHATAADTPPSDPPGRAAPSVGGLLAADGWAVLIAAVVTAAIVLGSYGLARAAGAEPREAILAALALMTMWVALSSASLAAEGKTWLSAAIRGAVPADTCLLALLILAPLARHPNARAAYLSIGGVFKIYCTLAALAVFSVAAVCLSSRPTGRRALALAVSLLLAAAVASPFWINGLLEAIPYQSGKTVVAWAVHANPFYSVTGAIVERVRFFWHEWGMMYGRIGRFADYPPPPIRWYSSALIYGALASIVGLCAIVFRRRPAAAP
ncbi:MAG TPA: hypothetical protein VNA25_06210 [Phycisphaerae bacterium]|nr:hypothetical protein [Phycisphaerae bacterium]